VRIDELVDASAADRRDQARSISLNDPALTLLAMSAHHCDDIFVVCRARPEGTQIVVLQRSESDVHHHPVQ
jgi:hypothetical protein